LGPIQPGEPITRYIFQKSFFNKEKMFVKTGAFMPNRDNKTSVFRIKNYPENEIWTLGEKIGVMRNRSLKARADKIVDEIFKTGLKIIQETSQYERHADIIGWPKEPEKQQLLASALARDAYLRLLT